VRDDSSLAGARAGEDEERPLLVENGCLLFGVEAGEQVHQTDGQRAETGVAIRCLFYRDGLREVSRLVDVTAAPDGYVVGKKLQWDGHDDRRE
jgi:hypothetical protein